MDPLTTFSLVCGVIQVVDFSIKTLSKCKELYREGSLSEYQKLEDLTNHLVDVRDKLELTTVKQNVGVLGAAEDQSLLDIAGQCSTTAEHLVEKLRSLKIEGPRQKLQAVSKTFIMLWKKGELQDIQSRVDGYRNVLDTQILINLRYVRFGCPASSLWHLKLICPRRYENRQRFDLAALQHSQDFQSLDQNVQSLVKIVSQEPKGFEELKDLIRNEKKEIKESINSGFQKHERRRADREQHTRLLKSLWFAEILSREETIAEAHRKTFQWIFDRSGRAVRPWSNFTSWLEDGKGIYWISGKAGSGKSTLMNFLCQDERTKDLLEIWSGSKDILMVKFFFWSAGTLMQKNFDGLLRSLLWQILREFPDMDILQTSNESSLEEKRRRASYSQGSIGVWTKRRLLETLHDAINKLQSSCYLCFFIDGLDEFDDDKDDLIEFVQDIVSNTGVKVCLSSRPDREFEEAFGSSARLRLQDLTHDDIRRYVNDRFQSVPQLVSMASENEDEMNQVKKRIVDRAEGVFLWVSLAVKDQIRGLRNDDSPEQLQQRLARLPSEIEGVYARMLERIDKIYLQEASSFLKMALNKRDLSVLELALASYPGVEDILSSADEVPERKVVLLCQSTRKKLITRCAGLLEVHEKEDSDQYTDEDYTDQDTDEEDSDQDTDEEDTDQETIERQTISDPTRNFCAKHLEASSEVDISASDFQRETSDDFNRENELSQPHHEPGKGGPASRLKPNITDVEIWSLEMSTIVGFVHRTAVDFLENSGPGNTFLDTNSLPEFDPQAQFLKAKLGELRLREESKLKGVNYWGQPEYDIDRIMQYVASLEESSRMPQVSMCELIDRTMSQLDRRYPNWSSDSHWSARWGRLAGMRTRSSPTTNVDNSGATQTDSRTFLGFAASHGLSLYVIHVLNCREKKVGSEELDDLLCCSIFGASRKAYSTFSRSRALNLVPELLSRGAKPNARFMGETIWGKFQDVIANKGEQNISFADLSRSRFSNALALATIAFIEHGADLGTVWSRTINISLHPSRVCPFEKCSFDLRASALSIIALILQYEPHMPPMSRICDARSAVRYLRCTNIRFMPNHRTEKGKKLMRQFKLSEQKSKDFMEILKLWTPGLGGGETLSHQLSEFYTRLLASRSGASNLSSMIVSDA